MDSLLKTLDDESQASSSLPNPPPTIAEEAEDGDGSGSVCGSTGDRLVGSACPARPQIFRPREQLMLRANSLKKAIRQIIEHTEKGIGPFGGRMAVFRHTLGVPEFLEWMMTRRDTLERILAHALVLPHAYPCPLSRLACLCLPRSTLRSQATLSPLASPPSWPSPCPL